VYIKQARVFAQGGTDNVLISDRPTLMNRSEQFKYFYKKLPPGSQLKFCGAVFFTFAPIWAVAVSRLAADRSSPEVLSYFVASGIIAMRPWKSLSKRSWRESAPTGGKRMTRCS